MCRHTKDCLVAYLPQEKILIPGDTLEAPLPLIIEVGNIPVHIENLKKLNEMDIKLPRGHASWCKPDRCRRLMN